MTIPASPRRLRDGGAFSVQLQELSSEGISSERLDRNERALKARVLALGIGVGAASATKTALGLKLWLPLAVAAVGGGYALHGVTTGASDAAPTAASVGVRPPSAPVTRSSALPGAPAEVPTSVARVPAVSAAARSDLPEQLQLFGRAKAAANKGDYRRALALLSELEQRHPKTPLHAEIELSRADYLARAGNFSEAGRVTERLLQTESQQGKRAELLQLLGDARAQRGDCTGASQAYREALRLGLPGARAEAARNGLERCERR